MKDLCSSPFVTVPLDDPSILKNYAQAENKSYAMVSVPYQSPVGKLYSACEGLSRGTVFADLDQPYVCAVPNYKAKEVCDCG